MSFGPIISAVLFASAGVLLFAIAFFAVVRGIPGNAWPEVLEKKNTALAIVVAGLAIAIGSIVASAFH